MQSNEEQGFSCEPRTQLVQLNYIPMFSHHKQLTKTYENPLTLPTPYIRLPTSFVNQKLSNKLSQRFMNENGDRIVYSCYSKHSSVGSCVRFDSEFEGGNLEYVLESRKCHFQLFMKPDSNTSTHFQWFYFTVQNKNTRKISMTIKNFIKPDSLYRSGLKPYVQSLRKGDRIYRQITKQVSYELSQEQSRYPRYQLTFEYSFEFNNDQVTFCSQPPYTYVRYEKLMKSLSFSKIQMSKTLLGNKISAILINEHSNYSAVVVVMARQHPGEAVGSWLMQGFLNVLKEQSSLGEEVFWIVIPMVNVDGVVLGNNRTGLLGYDFNRNWCLEEEAFRQHLFPEITGILKYFKTQKRRFAKKTKLFIDFHGHSSQANVFCYGPPHHENSQYFNNSRLFPYLISKRNADFNLKQCSFEIEAQKRNCSRSVFFNKLGFAYSYTIESSFGMYRGRQITEGDVIRMGEDVCHATCEFMRVLLHKNQKKEEDIRMIVSEMEKELGKDNLNQYNSDSEEEEEQNMPLRMQFQQKVSQILIKKRSSSHKSTANTSLTRCAKDSLNEGRTKTDRYGAYNYSKLRNQRIRTEQISRLNNKISHNQSIYLPRLSPSRRMRTRLSPLNNCYLDNMTLQQIKERLLHLKHSKLGKRILILNCHQNAAI